MTNRTQQEWREASEQFLTSLEGRDFPGDDPINLEVMVRYIYAHDMDAPDKLQALKDAYKFLKKIGVIRR